MRNRFGKDLIIGHVGSPVGELTMASDGECLKGLWIKEQKYFPAGAGEQWTVDEEAEIFEKTREWLEKYFNGDSPDPDKLPLAPEGSDFRKQVWEILLRIPYGETVTYGEIGAIIARDRGLEKMSAQAVGGAVGHNPIAIIIPCHRVIGKDRSLTGYAGGLNVKRQLLTIEGLIVDENDLVKKNDMK